MKRKGSAIITVVVAIVVLVVLALGFISSKHERAGISKMMSDEKKCEAIAESAADYILSYLRKTANKHDDQPNGGLYYLLRAPLKYSTTEEANKNTKLDVTGAKPIEDLDSHVGFSVILQPVIEDLGWTDKVEVESKCEISSAEAFSPTTEGYKVTGINNEHYEARGHSAKFLDSSINDISFDTGDENDTNWKPSDWTLSLKFPNNDPKKFNKTFKIHLSLSTDVFDVMSVLDESHEEVSAAREAWDQAKSDYNAAVEAGASDEELASLQQKVDSTRIAWEQATAKDEATNEDYKKELESIDGDEGIGVNVDLTVERANEYSMVLGGKATLHSKILKKAADLFGIQTEYKTPDDIDEIDCNKLIEESRFFPDIRPVNMTKLADTTINNLSNLNYDFSEYVSGINARMQTVSAGYQGVDLSSDDMSDPDNMNNIMVIEKGAILRITTNVKYQQSPSKTIKRTLVTEIPFKVSDVQPIAPEYTLFIANSPRLCNQGDLDQEDSRELGTPVDLNNADVFEGGSGETFTDAMLAAGTLVAHNIYGEDETKPDYNNVGGSTGRVPGMIRVNTNYGGTQKDDETSKLRCFIGCFDEPQLTEMNQMFTPNYKHSPNRFNTFPSFYWADDASDDDSAKRYHEVEFPLLFDSAKHREKIPGFGLKHFMDVYRRGGFDIVMVPTLLYGRGHMEYPLGINAEGPINTVYTRIRVGVKPNVNISKAGFVDMCEVYYSYEPVCMYGKNDRYRFDTTAMKNSRDYDPAAYGMVDHGSYEKNETWYSDTDYKYMPANCYDTMQYAKKATRFYETAEEFKADMDKPVSQGGLKDGNNIVLAGVYYIKSDQLALDGNLTFKGNGLIVCKNDITITGNIDRADEDTVIGFIARLGRISFDGTSKQSVHGAFYSNSYPISNAPALRIYGNLVCNDFVRKYLLDVEIFYDNKATCVTPLSSMRKIGKFEPKRYYVAFAENWSKFAYENTKTE